MNQKNFLSSDNMNNFLVGLAGLPKDELKKAKILYIKNAIIEYENSKKQFNQWLYIPILGWLTYLLNKPFINVQFDNMRKKIFNAIEVWKEDLVGETFILDNKTINV